MGQFTAWLHLPPGTKISGGKLLDSRRLPTTNRAARLLRLAAAVAGRTNTELGAYYRRMAARKGKTYAVVATAHKLARIIYAMLKKRTPFYIECGVDAANERQRELRLRSLRRRAQSLGFDIVAQEAAAVTG
jgi:hypothetical protein